MNLKKLLPFLEEEDLEELADKILSSQEDNYEGITLEMLLPFLDDDYVSEACKKDYQKGKSIVKYLPFMDDDDVDDAFFIALKENRPDLVSFLPFVSEDAVDKAVELIKDGKAQVDEAFLGKLLPFMDDDAVDDLFLVSIKSHKPYSQYLPFVSDEALHEAVKLSIEGKAEVDLDSLLPFLDDDDIRDIFHSEMHKNKARDS
ncbi:MAG: hypothetical protein WCR16_03090 [Bacilli bacterium]